MLASHNGRNQLTQLLRQCLNIPTGQIPPGTPFVQTILDHEFVNQQLRPRLDLLRPATIQKPGR